MKTAANPSILAVTHATEAQKTAANSLLSSESGNRSTQHIIRECRKKIFSVVSDAKSRGVYRDPDIAMWRDVVEEMSVNNDPSNLQNLKELADIHVMNAVIGAHRSNQEFLALLSDARNTGLLSTVESRQLVMDFLSHDLHQGERDEMKVELKEQLKAEKETMAAFKMLLRHEMLDNAKIRLASFCETDAEDREEILMATQLLIGERNLARAEIKKETDASRKLCELKSWEGALAHCENAIAMIEEVEDADQVAWFAHRKQVISQIIRKLEEKIMEENAEDISEANQETAAESPDWNSQEAETADAGTEIHAKRKIELQHMLMQWFIQSNRASAATIKVFVHATDAVDIEQNRTELQNEVDAKDNLLIEDHEEEEDTVLCVESSIDRMMQEKVNFMAHDQDIERKTIAFVSDERVLSLEENDTAIAKDLHKVFTEGIARLGASTEETSYLQGAVDEILGNNAYAKQLRSDGPEGLDSYKTTLGHQFNQNKNNFAAEVTEAVLAAA